jgi:ribosomal-protein-alanine N-acetyltransferase
MIRALQWWDLDEVLTIEAEVFAANAWSAETFWAELARDDRYYAVAQQGERIVGYAGLWFNPPQADVQTLAVAPAAQGTGLGRRLLSHLVDGARERGCEQLHLEVRADNDAAIGLYRRSGFALLRRRERYYPDFSDALVMGLDL